MSVIWWNILPLRLFLKFPCMNTIPRSYFSKTFQKTNTTVIVTVLRTRLVHGRKQYFYFSETWPENSNNNKKRSGLTPIDIRRISTIVQLQSFLLCLRSTATSRQRGVDRYHLRVSHNMLRCQKSTTSAVVGLRQSKYM